MFCAGRSAAELDTWFHGLDPLFLFVLDSSLPTRLDSFLCAYLRFFAPCFPRNLLCLFPSPWVVPFRSIPLQLERPFLAWILPLCASLDSSLPASLGLFSLSLPFGLSNSTSVGMTLPLAPLRNMAVPSSFSCGFSTIHASKS